MIGRTTKSSVSILIGDSEFTRSRKIFDRLRKEGYDVSRAGSREEVIDQIICRRPELALISDHLLKQSETTSAPVIHEGIHQTGTCVIRLFDRKSPVSSSSEPNAPPAERGFSIDARLSAEDFCGRVECFIRLQQAEAALRRHTERIEAIFTAQRNIAAVTPDARTIMRLTAERAQELTSSDGAAIELLSGDELVVEAASGMLAGRLGDRGPMTHGASSHCIRTDEVLRCGDIRTDSRFDSEDFQAAEIASALVVPLRHLYNSVGTIKVVSKRFGAFGTAEEHALHLVVYFMSTAINQSVAFGAKQALLAEHTRTIVALRDSEERFRSAFDHAAIGMALLSTDGRWIKVNRSLCESAGYSPEEFPSLRFESLIHPEDLAVHRENVDELLAGKVNSLQLEERYFHKSGSVLWVLLNVSLLRDNTGRPLYFIAQIHDITDRKRSEEALIMQARVLKSMSEGVCLTDDAGVIVFTNRAEERIFGYQSGGLKGKHLAHLIDDTPEASRDFIKEILLHAKTTGMWAGEFRNRKKDGTPFTTATSVSLLDATGERHFVCVQEDITEKKLADEQIRNSLKEKEILLKEIHHRVKNNLQVISSLLNLQSGYAQDRTDTEQFRESQNRVRSMALIHEKLYKSQDLTKIDLKEYVQSLAAMVFRSYGANSGLVKLNLRMDSLNLSIDTAVPVGLLLNELVSNSLKHAFRDGRCGNITIELRKNPDEGFLLVYRDDGIGFPAEFDLDKTDSLGLRLVKILTDQIGGRLNLRNNNGAEFEVRVEQR